MSDAKAALIASLLASAEPDKDVIADALDDMSLMLVFILPKLLVILPALVAIPEALVAMLLTFVEIPDALVALIASLFTSADPLNTDTADVISDAKAALIASLFTSAEEDKEVNCTSLA